jgi:RNA polymerase sigma factor (sigma-70 family)
VPDPEDFLSRLFSESSRALRRYVRALVGSREKAEDIVQEAFLRTYEHRRNVTTPRAFLFSAARNLAIDARRHERIARTDSVGDVEVLGVVSGSVTPEAQALADERSQLLRQAIEHLPPQCRAVFALKVFHACSYQEISQRLGISVKTVEKHVGRGLKDTHQYVKRHYRDAGAKP